MPATRRRCRLHCTAKDWWQAVLVFAILTGWRIGEIVALRRNDLDLKTGEIVTRSGDNKGGREEVDHLPTAALEHIKGVAGFGDFVFEWPHSSRSRSREFHAVQGGPLGSSYLAATRGNMSVPTPATCTASTHSDAATRR